MRSVTPLISLSSIGSLVWLLKQSLKKSVTKDVATTLVLMAVLLLITTNRFVFHSFYINNHLFFGTITLIMVGLAWLIATKKNPFPQNAGLWLISIMIPAIILTRAEASINTLLTLLPLLTFSAIAFKKRLFVLSALAGSMIVWQSIVSINEHQIRGSISLESYGLLIAGLALLLVAAPLLKTRFISRHAKLVLYLAEGVILLGLIIFAINDSAILTRSIEATIQNTVHGSWGYSIPFLLIFFTVLVLTRKFKYQEFLRFPITAFFIVSFFLTYISGGRGYRVGDGDSFTRMLVQILPTLIFFIVVAVAISEPKKYVKNIATTIRLLR